MEALYTQPLQEDGGTKEEAEEEKSGEQEGGGMEASSPTGSTTDEETDEDSEPEPPLLVRRKVSFADAFGLNLVSVKEFDNADVTESENGQSAERESTPSLEEFYMSCLFTVPSSPEELDQTLQAQMVELESIELLPGTTTLRGIIRVVNLCYKKCVYARITLDHWSSYFDLLAEYVPGSSDRKTDRFTFKYTLVPTFERQGTRVEFCLRYETSAGTFWANNKGINYVLFCHQKGYVKEHWLQMQDESTSYKSKRSCLKANRNGGTEEKPRETINSATAAAEVEETHKAQKADRKTMDSAEMQSLLCCEEHKPLMEIVKSSHKSTRLARMQDYLTPRRQQVPKAFPHDSANGQKVSQPMPAPWGDSARFLYKCQKTQSNNSPQVLTYHQIPLLTLDWNNDKPQPWGAADVDDIWNGRAKMTLSKASEENRPSVNDMWETFLNDTDHTGDKETSVCDVWQDFLNGPRCKDHSGVPESEWLQTAASVSPSNDKELQTQYAASSQEFQEFQVGADTPTTLHTLAACHLLSDTRGTLLANVTLNTDDHHPAEACVSRPQDDNTVTQDASQRSQTNSVTDTPQEFSLKGAPPVSEGSVDSSTECHKHAVWEQEREGIIGGAEGKGGDEPFTLHSADSVTSSGESETTDMTAMPESQNASAGDRISQGARLDGGLSSSGEGEVTGTAHNAKDDMLAFRETIRQGTKDGVGYVFSTSRQGAEEESTTNYTENRVPTEETLFRPQKTEECEISPRYADEMQCEKFRLNLNSEEPLQEAENDDNKIRPAQSHADGSDPNQRNFEQNKIVATEFNKDMEVFKMTEVETNCTTSKEEKRLKSTGGEMIHGADEQAWSNDKPLLLNSSWQTENTSVTLEVHDKQSRPIQAGEEICVQKGEDVARKQTEESVLKSEKDQHVLVLNQTGDVKRMDCDRIVKEQQEMNPSTERRPILESREVKKGFLSYHETFRPCPTEKCNQNPVEVVELRWTHSQEDVKGHKEDVGSAISSEEVMAKENVAKQDTSTEHQPETSERTKEDMSQEDKDERVRIGKLKIEAMGELMGNVESPRGERRNAPAEMKEQELSAEVESSPRVEYRKLSDGTKDPIMAENTATLEVTESRLEEMFIERFGEDLVRRVLEEVFGREVQASKKPTLIVDRKGYRPRDTTQDCHLPSEKDFDNTLQSGEFPFTESPTDSNLSLCQGVEQTLVTKGNEYSPKERSQTPTTTEQTHSLSELQTDLNTSVHLSQDLSATSAAHCRRPLTESTQALSSAKDQEIKERSVTHHDTGRQMDDCVVAHKESFNRLAHPSHQQLSSSSDGLIWWSIFYTLSHITRLLSCTLLAGGFFVIVFLYDFPAFFALYIFSLCWWFYKWRRHQVTMNKGMVG